MEEKLNLILSKIEAMDKKIDSIDSRLGNVETDVKGLKTDVKELKTGQEELRQEMKDGFKAMNHCFNTVYDKIEKQKSFFRSHSGQLRNLTERIEDLEGTFKPETVEK